MRDDEPTSVEAAALAGERGAPDPARGDDAQARCTDARMLAIWRQAVKAAQQVGASWDDARPLAHGGHLSEPSEDTLAFAAPDADGAPR